MPKRRWNPRSGFQQGHPFYRSNKPGAYVSKRFRKEDYEPCDSVPEGLTWKPCAYKAPANQTVLLSLGNNYKLVRDRTTGAVEYFKLKGIDAPISPAAKIDAEPTRGHQVRYRVGCRCWFVVEGHWFLCTVENRTPHRITLRPEQPWDADKLRQWPYPETLEIIAQKSNALFQQLRPLKDRYV